MLSRPRVTFPAISRPGCLVRVRVSGPAHPLAPAQAAAAACGTDMGEQLCVVVATTAIVVAIHTSGALPT